jgi:hypothetical protein
VESGAISQPALEQIARIRPADLVVGVLSPGGNGWEAASGAVREAIGALAASPRTVLVVDDGAGGARVEEEQSLPVLFCQLSEPGGPEAVPQRIYDAYRAMFDVSAKMGARACCVIAPGMQAVTSRWIDRLVRPVLEMEFDLVTPRYDRRKLEGLINRAILSPLSRALYGIRIENPIGPDLGFSGRLIRTMLDYHVAARRGSPGNPLPSIVPAAVGGKLRICEAHLGARHQPPADYPNLSSLLAQILGPVFLDMEHNAALWQRARRSEAVPAFGGPEVAPEDSGAVDVRRLIDSFQLGAKNLQDVWSLVLSPTSLLEIRKLARLPPGQFRMSDDLWVWIVCDFALAHRIRAINRDHLLRSFTPLYLGWVASYALEMEGADSAAVDGRLERLALAYEAGKPRLVSRWRWPDRFNP